MDKKKLKQYLLKDLIGSQDSFQCANCGRDIFLQKIAVFRPKTTRGVYVCVCQLHKYLNGKNEVYFEGGVYDYRNKWFYPVFLESEAKRKLSKHAKRNTQKETTRVKT